jgi:hypothetical protein
MATVGALCTTIIGDLQRSDTSLSDIVLIDIQSSIRDYEAQRFYFNERLLSVTFSNTYTYALSLYAAAGSGIADIIEVDGITVAVSSTRSYDLEEKTSNWVMSRLNNAVLGYPEFYALFNQSVLIDPYPASGQNYTSTMAAHVKFTEIAAGGFATSNVWTNDASELIRNATLKRLYGRRFKSPEDAAMAAEGERLALAALRRRTDAVSGGRLEPDW